MVQCTNPDIKGKVEESILKERTPFYLQSTSYGRARAMLLIAIDPAALKRLLVSALLALLNFSKHIFQTTSSKVRAFFEKGQCPERVLWQ
jgi:hypothetical protein